MYCPSCGTANQDTGHFCTACGFVLPLSGGEAAATIAPPPPPTLDKPSTGITGQANKVARQLGGDFAERYEILGILGEGGMGRVYRAKDRELNEVIAIKVLTTAGDASGEEVARFKREIITARRISHVNVIRIHDFGFSGQDAFISMEYLTGGSLSDRLEQGPLPWREGVRIARDAARGLLAAHSQGVVHRDMKPHNILFDELGNVKIADFGIARLQNASQRTGGIFGTPHYMSPEQAQGLETDVKSDIYSLGVVMYQMFTGRLPFQGDNLVALAMAHVKDPAPRPREVYPQVPGGVEAVILKCMLKGPEYRYPSVRELIEDLHALYEGRWIIHAEVMP